MDNRMIFNKGEVNVICINNFMDMKEVVRNYFFSHGSGAVLLKWCTSVEDVNFNKTTIFVFDVTNGIKDANGLTMKLDDVVKFVKSRKDQMIVFITETRTNYRNGRYYHIPITYVSLYTTKIFNRLWATFIIDCSTLYIELREIVGSRIEDDVKDTKERVVSKFPVSTKVIKQVALKCTKGFYNAVTCYGCPLNVYDNGHEIEYCRLFAHDRAVDIINGYGEGDNQ